MPLINTKPKESILDFIQTNFPNADIKLLNPLPRSIEQHGHTCKLYALSVAMNYAFIINHHSQALPPPARKRDRLNSHKQLSLRKRAKALGSKIGEIYDGHLLIQLAKENGFEDSQLVETTHLTYIDHIKEFIDKGNDPIVFFDVDPKNGEPQNKSSQCEHAAVVTGYFSDGNKIYFILAQWGNYYYVDAKQLADSANQLVDVRQPEEFYKVNGSWRQKGDRLDLDHTLLANVNEKTKRVVSNPINFSFKNKIVAIKGKSQSLTPEILLPKNLSEGLDGISFQWGTKNFIRLDKLINFIDVDSIRPDSYSESTLESFASLFQFNDEIISLTQKKYNTEVDESLEDDIYRQNPKKSRSITELVSNAIDTKSENIYVQLKDGEYSVRDAGCGMSPQVIFRKLLIPKATSKENAEESIGQFGLGFYTALAHLESIDDKVVVRTKAKNCLGYCIEFRKIGGKIAVNMGLDITIKEHGSEITVTSSKIYKDTFIKELTKNIRHLSGLKVFINESLVNKIDLNATKKVSKSNIIIGENEHDKGMFLTIAGITIQSEVDDNSNHSMKVVWALPKLLVSISESRNQARLDSDDAREEIRKLIDFGHTLSDELKTKYFNTIALFVYNLQQNNSSQSTNDNVFYYLQLKIKKLYAHKKQVPDLSELKPLIDKETVVLHPILVDANWRATIGYVAPEWKSGNRVIIVKMNPVLGSKFIHDQANKIIYLDQEIYEQAIKHDELYKLALLFSLPPGEIEGSWNEVLSQNNNLDPKSTLSPLVPLEKRERPNDKLYQKHGILSKYGDTFTSQLSKKQQDVILHAETLMQIYPMQKTNVYGSYQELGIHFGYETVVPFYFADKQFYLVNVDSSVSSVGTHNFILLDHTFSQLFFQDYLLLLEKALQIYKAKELTPDSTLSLSKSDRLLVKNSNQNGAEVFNGNGVRCIDKKFNYSSSLTLLNDKYFIIVEYDRSSANTYLYNINNALVAKLTNGYTKISENPLLLGVKNYNNEEVRWNNVYSAETNKEIIPFNEDNSIMLGNGFFINVRKHCFNLISKTGKILFSFQNPEQRHINFVDCKCIDGQLFLSLQCDYDLKLLILNPQKTGEYQLSSEGIIPKDKFISYPACAYFVPSKQNGYYGLKFINKAGPDGSKEIGKVLHIDMIKLHHVFGPSWSFIRDPYYKGRKLSPLDELVLVEYYENKTIKKIIIDNNAIIKLPLELYNCTITDITKSFGFYKISISGKENSEIIINVDGKIIAQANKINHYKEKECQYFLLDNHIITDTHGKIILSSDDPIAYIEIAPELNTLLICYNLKNNSSDSRYDVINQHGKSVVGGPIKSMPHVSNEGITYKTAENTNHLITPNGVFKLNKFINSTRSFLTPSERYNDQNLYYYEAQGKCYLINAQGQSMFADGLECCYTIGKDIISTYKFGKSQHLILNPLKPSNLTSATTQENLSFLNACHLSPFDYGYCLRFIEIENNAFKVIYPYMTLIDYVPNKKQVKEFEDFFNKISIEVEEERQVLAKLLSLVYSISGSYVAHNMANKIAQLYKLYGIYAIQNAYDELQAQKNIKINPQGIIAERGTLREMSKTTGVLFNYIFFDNKDLFVPCELLINQEQSKAQSPNDLSMIDLLVAQRLNAGVAGFVANGVEFKKLINSLTKGTNKHNMIRRMTHAMYHQADPNSCLYLREFIQNALDAYAENNKLSNRNIDIDIGITANKECVLSLRDKGIGMTLEQIFKYLLIPGLSSKRHAVSGKYIGGRGVGLFTAFPGAKQVLLKTSIGDGKTHYIVLTPKYTKLKSGEQRVVDVTIDWKTKDEAFQGTLIQRVSFNQDHALEAAKYHRAIGTHAKFINRSEFAINLNGEKVNDKLIPLIQVDIPGVGITTFYKSKEKAITAGGLFVKDLPEDITDSLPSFIKRVIDNHSLVIQLPKTTPLNRERNDFQDCEQFNAHLKKHLNHVFYDVYLALFLKGEAQLDEIPYDLFNEILERTDHIRKQNPEIEKDAFILNSGGSLSDYTKYKDSESLTNLMCFLEIIKYKPNDRAIPKMNSIVDLGLQYRSGELQDVNLPPAIKRLIEFDKACTYRINMFNKMTDEIEIFRNIEWKAQPCADTKHLNFFIELCRKITVAFSNKAVDFYFSTTHGDTLAYMKNGESGIYWNIVNIFNHPYIGLLLKSTQDRPLSYNEFSQGLKSTIEHISHELTHLHDSESNCSGTHNKSFYLRQRKLLEANLLKINTRELYSFYLEYYNHLSNKVLPSAVDCIKIHLTPHIDFIKNLLRQPSRPVAHAEIQTHETQYVLKPPAMIEQLDQNANKPTNTQTIVELVNNAEAETTVNRSSSQFVLIQRGFDKITTALKVLKNKLNQIEHPLQEAITVATCLLASLEEQQLLYIKSLTRASDAHDINDTSFHTAPHIMAVNQAYVEACEKLINNAETRGVLERDLNWGAVLNNLLKTIANAIIWTATFGQVNNFFTPQKAETLRILDEGLNSLKPDRINGFRL